MKRIVALTCLSILVTAGLTSQPASAEWDRRDVPQRVANCLYERYPDRAQRLLNSANAGAAENAYVSLLDEPLCMDKVIGDHEYSPDETLGSIHLMRGMLAEQAIKASRPQAEALPAMPAEANAYARPWFAASGRNPVINEMAACVADTNPSGILAVLATAPSSSEESAAMRRLDSSIKRCLAARTRIEAGTLPVRAALADALYQRMRNPTLSQAKVPENHQ